MPSAREMIVKLMRNLGGAVGLAVINTLLSDRGDLHYARLSESITWSNPEAMRQLNMLAQNLESRGLDGESGAIAQMAGRVHQQATVMSFADVFFLLTILFASLALFAMLMRKPASEGGSGAGH